MYAIIHFPQKTTSIHNHLDGSSTRIQDHFPTFSPIFASRFAPWFPS